MPAALLITKGTADETLMWSLLKINATKDKVSERQPLSIPTVFVCFCFGVSRCSLSIPN